MFFPHQIHQLYILSLQWGLLSPYCKYSSHSLKKCSLMNYRWKTEEVLVSFNFNPNTKGKEISFPAATITMILSWWLTPWHPLPEETTPHKNQITNSQQPDEKKTKTKLPFVKHLLPVCRHHQMAGPLELKIWKGLALVNKNFPSHESRWFENFRGSGSSIAAHPFNIRPHAHPSLTEFLLKTNHINFCIIWQTCLVTSFTLSNQSSSLEFVYFTEWLMKMMIIRSTWKLPFLTMLLHA